ncbi:MAG: dephospho-CoA kinase [Proteobacteria bacterium]|jgi:dephospho-CoA kinase|nr:dephospho-CoA kinase [Pseudomonadota bacterium]MCC6633503.1 dephospho-CoA kinase [Gammaproteobacteria bacterium]
MLRIALTGGVASGKSTVARLFEALGAKLIDTDQVARDIVAPGTPALAQIAGQFGPEVLRADGALDRARLREIVFSDPAARARLEAITHPAIRERVAGISARAGGPYQIIAVPLLVETGTQRQYDRVLLVDCDPQVQLGRLMLRDGLTAEQARSMLAAQASRAARLAVADDVIANESGTEVLAPQVESLHRRYLQMAGTLSGSADRPD